VKSKPITPEQMELSLLREENARLKIEKPRGSSDLIEEACLLGGAPTGDLPQCSPTAAWYPFPTMPRLSMAPVFLREWLGPRLFPREPEPALVMDDPEQVAAYDYASRIDGVMAAAYLFHSARASQVISSCTTVLDLGCGPAVQLGQIAALNPYVQFIGVDLSGPMLERAGKLIAEKGLTNVRCRRDDITTLSTIESQSVDGVISTMVMHHLPTSEHLHWCFSQIARVLKPGGALYVVDFGRLKCLPSVLYFAYQNAKHQPHLFSLDFERSLRAAFLPEDFEQALRHSLAGRARVYSTYKVPFLVLIKSEDRPLTPDVIAHLKAMRDGLPRRYRRDLDDLRTFFSLGGLREDPFRI
jgi:arsenite methyltransferase